MSTTKRTRRTGIKQSKYGCTNCKQRKVKCDEKRPGCDNCAKGNRICTWASRPGDSRHNSLPVHSPNHHLQVPTTPSAAFPSPARTVTSLTSSSPRLYFNDPPFANTTPLMPPEAENDLINQACQIVNRSCIDDFQFLPNILAEALFQYSYLCESTQHAASAVVAAAETLKVADATSNLQAVERTLSEYSLAVSSLLTELTKGVGGSSVSMTAVFLACVDMMLRRRQNVNAHFSRLRLLLNANSPPLSPDPQQAFLDTDILLRSLEIHRMASADLAVQNEIRPVQFRNQVVPPSDLPSLGRHTINLVHASYAHITRASLDFSQDRVMPDLEQQHNILLGNISQTGSMVAQLLLQPGSDQDLAHLQRLQCICTAMFIKLANLFCMSEESFDNYARQFETIITAAEQILSARRRARQTGLPPFSWQIGIVQPLFLAATKYRRRSWRLRAIACLKNAGQEGPWSGALLAAVAQRCAQVEEAYAIHSPEQPSFDPAPQTSTESIYRNFLSQHSATEEPSSIPDYARITAIRFIDDTHYRDVPDTTDTATNQVLFIQRMFNTSALPANVMSCFDNSQKYMCPGLFSQPLDQTWYAWSENIPL